MTYTYNHPRPAVTVDCVVFGLDGQNQLKVLLIQRRLAPFVGQWALPGGFVHLSEDLAVAARRELAEETGVVGVTLRQLEAFGTPERDPRGRVITIAYSALVNLRDYRVQAATDAKAAAWFALTDLPALAFDHSEILQVALSTLQTQIRQQPIGFELLPERFTLTQLQQLYETILQRPLDKRNFRKKLLKLGFLVGLNEKEANVAHRAAQLYRFDPDKYQALRAKGFSFDL
ncbi:MAG: NUDIX domain-containing protein [Cyanobacteria bacterium J06648_16]